jgi:hypothetical protein
VARKKKKTQEIPLPTFRGEKAKPIPMEEGPQSFVFVRGDQVLHLAWDVDREGYGFWRLRLVGIENGRPIKKEFRAGQERVAFHGAVTVLGPAGNEMYDSFCFSDEDCFDHEKSVINKPVEILIRPHRED